MLSAALSYMLEQKIISHKTVLDLFNKGEPSLHPEFQNIINIVNSFKLRFTLSTNASHPSVFDGACDFTNLDRIIFSVPGFSAESYQKNHGFDFEKIKSNIVSILKSLRDGGFTGTPILSFHVYKYNHDEMFAAAEFAAANGIAMHDYLAYVMDYEKLKQIVRKTMPADERRQVADELFLYDEDKFDKVVASAPKNYWCEYERVLVLDEQANVYPCCVVDRFVPNSTLGNLFDMKLEDIAAKKAKAPICKECQHLNIAFICGIMQKYRAHDINRLYGKKIIQQLPPGSRVRRLIDSCIVRSYIFAISRWGRFGYHANKFLNLKALYRFLVRKLT